MSIKRKIGLAVAGILVCIAVLIAGLYGYSRTSHARNLVVNQINGMIPGTISAGKIRVLAGGAVIRLEDIQLLDTTGNSCLTFDYLDLQIRWGALFDKILEVRHFQIDGLHLDLTAAADGSINLVDALVAGDDIPDEPPEKDTPGAGLPLNVKIKTAQITRGTVSFSDPENTVAIGSLDVTVADVDLQQISGAVAVKVEDMVFSSAQNTVEAQSLSLSASVKEKTSGSFQMDLNSGIGVLTASGSVQDMLNHPQIDLTADLTTDLAAVSQISSDIPDLGGTIHLNLSGRGPVNDPAVQLRITGRHLAMVPDIQDGSLDVSADLAERILTLEPGQAELLGISTTFSGSVDLSQVFPEGFLQSDRDVEQLAYILSFNQTGGDLEQLAPWIPGFSGQFTSRGRVQGRGVSVETLSAGYELAAVFKGFKQDQADIDPLDLNVQVSGDIDTRLLTLDQLTVDTRPAQVRGSGNYHLTDQMLDLDLTVSSDDLDAATRAFGLLPARGQVDAAVQAQGPVSGPEITATVKGRDLGAAGIVLDRLDVRANLDRKGHATLTDFTVQGPGLDLTASGAADLFDTGFALKKQIQTSLNTKGKIRPETVLAHADLGVDPRFLDSEIAFDLKSRVTYDMGASLAVADIADITIPQQNMNARINLNDTQVSLFLENLVNITGALDMDKSTYTLDIDFSDKDFNPLLSAVGITGISGAIQGWVRSAGTLPGELTTPIKKHLSEANGSVTIEADVSGTVHNPDFNAVVDLADLTWHPEDIPVTITGLNGRMTLSPDRMTIHELTTRINQGRVTLNGEAAVGSGGGSSTGFGKNMETITAALNLSAEDITFQVGDGDTETVWVKSLESSLDLFLDISQRKETGPSGASVTGLGGTIPVKAVQAVLKLNQSDQSGLDLSVILDQTIDLKAAFNPETSQFDVNTTFTATPLAPFFDTAGLFGVSGQMDGQIESSGRINMTLPPQITEQLKPAAGTIKVSADAAGTFFDPKVDAGIVLEGLRYPVPEAGLVVSNLNGTVNLSNDRLKIASLTADLGQGTLDVSGDLELKNFMPVSGQARLLTRNVTVSVEDTLEAAFNTDLTFSGSREKFGLTGNVEMIHGEFYRDFEFDLADALESRKMGRTGPVDTSSEPGDPSFFENTALDIAVNYKAPFILDNNLAFIMVEPDLKITGTISQPVITGRANIVEGTVVYQKRQFDIEKGVIDFVDPFRIDPKITLQANTAIRKWVIYMDVSGKTDNLRFKLYSHPAETHEDILSLLIIGKTTKELGGGGGSYTGILADKASEMISKEVASSTPLDSFALGYDESGDQGGSVSVTMGKKLSERLEVIYSMDTQDQETVHTNAAEYKMLENVILRAFNDSKGDFGTEITLKLEFR
ncbi:MAG: translocation/assembly module TamB domain-containing protein [Desulfotignum sp.]|nr:translocation/assembly module TamB domain-containing protein [Desulfotignum sp.]